MSTHAQATRWSDSETPALPSNSTVPVQTTFRHMPTSPAVVDQVTKEAQKLHRYCDRITHCHVVIAAPHQHHRQGKWFSIHVDLGVPHGPLVVDHETEAGGAQEEISATVHATFDIVRRRLEDHVRRLRGDVKRHGPQSASEV